jgi:hypothetical protein
MKKLFIVLSIWQILIVMSEQLSIPHDAEVLDGYKSETPLEDISPEDNRQFVGEQLDMNVMPIRDRRSPHYKVMESPGLRSHFHLDSEQLKKSLEKSRSRRELEDADKTRRELRSDEIEVEDDHDSPRRRSDIEDVSLEELPVAQKHTLNPSYYRTDEDRLMEKWVKSPYESRSHKEESTGDSQPEASANVGINARQPRVNFITQQGQSTNNKEIPDGPEARDQNRDQSQNNKGDDDSYRKPSQDRYYPANYGNANRINHVNDYHSQNDYNPYWDRNNYYPAKPSYDNRDRYYDDRYDRDRLYDRRYQMYMQPPSGMGAMQPPSYSNGFYYRHQYNDYDEYYPRNVPNYYYSDKRFDVPPMMIPPMEAREPPAAYSNNRPYLSTNDVNGYDRYPPIQPSGSPNTGRIIYYAHLPEITRSPPVYPAPNINRYGAPAAASKRYDPSYDYYYNNNYDRRGIDDYRNGRLSRMVKTSPIRDGTTLESTTTARISSAALPVRPFERYSYQEGLASYPHPYFRRYD